VLEIEDLGLTPIQMREVEEADSELVRAWLVAAAGRGIKFPTGLFLNGIRTGVLPAAAADGTKMRLIRIAETWIRNVGALVTEEELLAWLYDDRGQLRRYADDDELRGRMLALWRQQR
jgi:hypothetical protein